MIRPMTRLWAPRLALVPLAALVAVACATPAAADSYSAAEVFWGSGVSHTNYTDTSGDGIFQTDLTNASYDGTASFYTAPGSGSMGLEVSAPSGGGRVTAATAMNYGGYLGGVTEADLPASIVLTFHVSGTLSISDYDTGPLSVNRAGFQVYTPYDFDWPYIPAGADFLSAAVGFGLGDGLGLSATVDESFDVSVDVESDGSWDLALAMRGIMNASSASGTVDFMDTLAFSGITLADGSSLASIGATAVFDGGFSPDPVPEPASFLLVGSLAVGLGLDRRRRRAHRPMRS